MANNISFFVFQDELSLDGNPMLNLASFVTTYMEDEAEKLMTESFSKNFIDYEEYPQSAGELLPMSCAIISRLQETRLCLAANLISTAHQISKTDVST